jgi:hypothetical protein
MLLIVAACTSVGEGVVVEPTTTTSQPTAEQSTAEQSTTTIVAPPDPQSDPLLVGAEAVIPITPTEGVGSRPTLEWEPVDGAASYFLVVKDDSGAAYWAWSGSETSIPLGGADFPEDFGNGPTIGPGYTWSVSAYDGDGTFLAISGDHPVSP